MSKPTKVDPLLKKAIWHSHKMSELVDDNVYLKLNQSTPQTLTASPIFDNLTAGRIPCLRATQNSTITNFGQKLVDIFSQ